jgi:hypothetical protein
MMIDPKEQLPLGMAGGALEDYTESLAAVPARSGQRDDLLKPLEILPIMNTFFRFGWRKALRRAG